MVIQLFVLLAGVIGIIGAKQMVAIHFWWYRWFHGGQDCPQNKRLLEVFTMIVSLVLVAGAIYSLSTS